MSVIRAFIAIDLTDEIQKHLDQVSGQLQEQLGQVPVRWVPVHNIHLTLKFLGDVSLNNLEILEKMLFSEVNGMRPFEFSVGGLGAFPSSHRPRVIWVGVEAPPELGMLQSGIETEMGRLGYAREERSFSPHLTLGRVSRNASSQHIHLIGEVLEKTKVGFLGVTRVETVNLYRSDLNPGGAVYTNIFTAPLKKM